MPQAAPPAPEAKCLSLNSGQIRNDYRPNVCCLSWTCLREEDQHLLDWVDGSGVTPGAEVGAQGIAEKAFQETEL